ncbi:YceI family protein [Rufibacter sp. LB8]|uniref:YceI family protein n=1 Tax=Rufibacter sp. LB8 TaxID=2777781 RepID=UPI00178C211E|nr:YceI family protein [Rufibacter sp. LB8]
MKKIYLPVLLAAALGVSAFTLNTAAPAKRNALVVAAPNAAQSYTVQTDASTITWVGRKVTGEHTGNIKLASGTILFNKSMLRGGTFVMDMSSITCTDLQGNSNKNLVNHLRSDDFFSVEKNPTAMFAITNLAERPNAKNGAANYTITGDLTIKGIVNQVSFPAFVTVKKGVATAKATLKFDRTKWDIKYRSGNFFENIGDKAIHDDVELKIELVAKETAVAKKDKKEKDVAKS